MDLTDAYANGKYIPDAASYPPRWAAEAAAFRAGLGTRAKLDLTYGPEPRNRFDLFLPEGAPDGVVVFIHGGYWLDFDKSSWSHLAAGPLARGWAVAMPSYRLAPKVRISEITREVVAAVEAAAGLVDGPVIITGHSAGGHLSARMRCTDLGLSVADRLTRVVPISPVADLRPLLHTAMNAELKLDASEANAESPVLHSALSDAETVIWVGAEERPSFLDQARWLAEAWAGAVLRVAPGLHHFDVIEDLAKPDSPLTNSLFDPVRPAETL